MKAEPDPCKTSDHTARIYQQQQYANDHISFQFQGGRQRGDKHLFPLPLNEKLGYYGNEKTDAVPPTDTCRQHKTSAKKYRARLLSHEPLRYFLLAIKT